MNTYTVVVKFTYTDVGGGTAEDQYRTVVERTVKKLQDPNGLVACEVLLDSGWGPNGKAIVDYDSMTGKATIR